MKHDRNTLRTRLRNLRRRFLWIGSASGLVWGLAGAVLLFLIGAWLDLIWELSAPWRMVILAGAGAGGAVVLGVLVGRTIRAGRDAALARRLDQAAGSGGAILTGVELDGPVHEAYSGHAPAITNGLAALAVTHAASLALRAPGARAVPARPLGRSAAVLAIELAAVGLLAICLPGLALTQWNRFFRPLADVPPFSQIEFVVEPGDTAVLYGEHLDVRATVSGDVVERVDLVLEGAAGTEETLPMFLEPDGRWRTTLAKVTEPADYHVRAYRARSQKHRIDVITVPRIDGVRFRVEPPAYTRRAPYEGPLPKGGIAGLRGTKVQVWAESNRPLSGGRLTLISPGQPPLSIQMAPTAEGSHEVFGYFEIARDAKFQLSVIDVAEPPQASREPFGGTITLLPDQRPLVRIVQPQATSLATPNAVLPVVLSADDDYGISRLEMYRSLNDSRALATSIPLPAQPPRRAYETLQLPLARYGLEPGDTVKLFGRVEDNDPAGAKGSESAIVTVRIISQEDFEKMLRAEQGMEVLLSKYREAERRMESVAKDLEELLKKLKEQPGDREADKALREEAKRLSERLEKEAAAMRELAERSLPYDVDENLKKELEKLAKSLSDGAGQLDAMNKAPKLSNEQLQKELQKLAEKLGGDRKQFDQNAMEPLDQLAKAFPLLADASRFVILAQQQKDLAERLASLKGKDNPDDPVVKARMRDLEEEQRKLREELGTLLGDIESHLEQLPGDPQFDKLRETAAKFDADVRASGASEAMSQAESGLAEFSGTRGHQKAQEAADILDKFISRCQGMGSQCQGCLAFNPSLSQCLGNSTAQLLADMGLGMGSGPGSGFGMGPSGYSAMRGGNMGLYGSLPGMGDARDSREGRSGANPASPAGAQTAANPDETSRDDAGAEPEEAGTGEAAVPVQYRRRVGQYFQRIAEEASGKSR